MDTIVDFLLNFYGPTPYLLIFGILLFCGFGLPIPEDVTLFAGGLLAYYGVCDLKIMIAVCFCGVMIGDSIMWFLGHRFGSRLLQRWFFRKLLPADRLLMAREKFKNGGGRILFAARFMPGLRAPMFFSSGLLHVPFRRFFFYDGLAALISVPAIVWSVFYFGDEVDHIVRVIKKIEGGIVFVMLGIVLAILGKWWITHRKVKSVAGGSK